MLCACAGEVRPSPALSSLSISIFYVHIMCGLAQDVEAGERRLCREPVGALGKRLVQVKSGMEVKFRYICGDYKQK